jgi:uncharacterized protein (TIGR03000 family)
MRFGQQGFALFSFSVVAWALANPLTAYAGNLSDGSHSSSAGAHGSNGSSGGHNGGEPAAELGSDEQRAMFVLSVPVDAKVFFQGEPTSSTGTRRRYRSPVLKAGKTFAFTIRVEVQRNGRLVSNTQEPQLQAGSRVEIAFDVTEPDGDLVATQRDPGPSVSGPGTIRQVSGVSGWST